jgi:hypothetical protein
MRHFGGSSLLLLNSADCLQRFSVETRPFGFHAPGFYATDIQPNNRNALKFSCGVIRETSIR